MAEDALNFLFEVQHNVQPLRLKPGGFCFEVILWVIEYINYNMAVPFPEPRELIGKHIWEEFPEKYAWIAEDCFMAF